MKRTTNRLLVTLTVAAVMLISCAKTEPEAIAYGQDQCAYCKMSIVQVTYGTELITRKGKIFKFDSIECLAAFHVSATVPPDQVHSSWLTTLDEPGVLKELSTVSIVHSADVKSPMGVGLCAYSDPALAQAATENINGTILDWSQTEEVVSLEWSLGLR